MHKKQALLPAMDGGQRSVCGIMSHHEKDYCIRMPDEHVQ